MVSNMTMFVATASELRWLHKQVRLNEVKHLASGVSIAIRVYEYTVNYRGCEFKIDLQLHANTHLTLGYISFDHSLEHNYGTTLSLKQAQDE